MKKKIVIKNQYNKGKSDEYLLILYALAASPLCPSKGCCSEPCDACWNRHLKGIIKDYEDMMKKEGE